MFLLILRDLQYRRWRVALTILLMAIVMTLLFIMSGLVNQFNAEPSLVTKQTAGDLNWIVSRGTGGPFTSPRPLDAKQFVGVPGDSVLIAPGSMSDVRVTLVGRSYDGPGRPVLIAGDYPDAPGEVLVDESAELGVGEHVTFGSVPGRVVGLTQDATVLAGVPLAYVTLDFSQQLTVGGRDLVLAKLTDQQPELPSTLKLLTSDDVVANTLLPLDGAIASVALVQALLWLITVIVIAAVIYITALERTRDFAVLKAVGGRTRDLGLSLLVQGVLMTLVAVAVAGLLQSFLAPSFPMTVRVPSSAWITITAGATFAALAAGAAGVMRVRSTSPAEAFG